MTEYVRRLRAIVGGDELLQIPSVSVALRDDEGRVLLARHTEGDVWLLPGGAVEPGEAPADAAVREMWEETGLVVRVTRLVGVFGGSDFIVHYRNGDRTSYVTATFEAALEGGSARPIPRRSWKSGSSPRRTRKRCASRRGCAKYCPRCSAATVPCSVPLRGSPSECGMLNAKC